MADDSRPGKPEPIVFVTVAEAANMMRVSKMTVYRLLHSGQLPSKRVGKSFRIPVKAVEEYQGVVWITVAEAAEAFRVSKMTIYRLIQKQELRATQIRRSFRIARGDLEKYIREQQ